MTSITINGDVLTFGEVEGIKRILIVFEEMLAPATDEDLAALSAESLALLDAAASIQKRLES